MRATLIIGSLLALAACSNPAEQDNSAELAAKDAEIRGLQVRVEFLQTLIAATNEASFCDESRVTSLSDILLEAEIGSLELSEEDRNRIAKWETEAQALPNICREPLEAAAQTPEDLPSLTPPMAE